MAGVTGPARDLYIVLATRMCRGLNAGCAGRGVGHVSGSGFLKPKSESPSCDRTLDLKHRRRARQFCYTLQNILQTPAFIVSASRHEMNRRSLAGKWT